MFYLRSFGLEGRMLEIDFKVELIKQLLDRIDRVHAKGSLSRPAILQLVKAEERARLAKNTDKEAEIKKGREGVLKALKMEEADQYILLFPDMFISLIASALNDILYSLYWIIENDKSDMAKTLFEHFLKETEPIFLRITRVLTLFRETSSHGPQLLDRVSPLIRDLHGKLLAGAPLPLGLGPAYEPGKRSVATQRSHCPQDERDQRELHVLLERVFRTGDRLQSGSISKGETTRLLLPHHRCCLCLSICT